MINMTYPILVTNMKRYSNNDTKVNRDSLKTINNYRKAHSAINNSDLE